MGSLIETKTSVNLLEYLKSKTQVDYDSLDIGVAKSLGLFTDATSNQADSYLELCDPKYAALQKKSMALARQILPEFHGLTLEELAFEIAMVSLSMLISPHVSGSIHIMANPLYAYSTLKIFENGKRIAHLCQRLEPTFDLSRLVIKVPSTWEGLQACFKLKNVGINSLGTTLFTMEQAILAGEAGCKSISPFVHELRVHFDPTYHDTDPIFGLCVEAQRYYEQNAISTRVKACSLISTDEVMRMAGVAALTLPPTLLQALSEANEPESLVSSRSIFTVEQNGKEAKKPQTYESFLHDESKFRLAFARNNEGKGMIKTVQAINLFCDFQLKAEAMMKNVKLA